MPLVHLNQTDLHAFLAETELSARRELIANLLNDPNTEAFAPEVVSWLLNCLTASKRNYQRLEQERRDQKTAWLLQSAELYKQIGELEKKLDAAEKNNPAFTVISNARVIARMSDAIGELVRGADTDMMLEDDSAFRNLFDQWTRNYPDIIEAAKNDA